MISQASVGKKSRNFCIAQINKEIKHIILCITYNREDPFATNRDVLLLATFKQDYNSKIVSQTMVVARGAENILPTAWRRWRGGHSGGLNAMIDGLHHKLATIGAPSRLLQQPSFPEKKNQSTHPFSLPVCRFASQTCYYIHTIVPPVIQQSNLLLFLTQQGYVL